jgi:hypothetical protein
LAYQAIAHRQGLVDFTNPVVLEAYCLELLQGNTVSGSQTVARKGSFENERSHTITPYDALQELGKVYIGISAQKTESDRPLHFLAALLSLSKKQLLQEGWRWCVVYRIVDPCAVLRRYKIGYIEQQTQFLMFLHDLVVADGSSETMKVDEKDDFKKLLGKFGQATIYTHDIIL